MLKTNLKSSSLILGVILCGLLVTSCSSSPKKMGSGANSESGSGRIASFFSSGRSSYRLPPYQEKDLENGLKIIYIDDQSLPYITYSLMVKGGSSADPAELPGLTSLVGGLLEQGTAQRTAPQIADGLAHLGANFSDVVGKDYGQFTTSALSSDAGELLKLYYELLTDPAFSEVEVDRLRKNYIAEIKRHIDNPEAFIETAWDRYLYGEDRHPYAHPSMGTVKSISAIKRKNIIQQYKKYFRPNNSYLSVVGKLTPDLKREVEAAFGKWEKRDVPGVVFPKLAAIQGTSVSMIDKAGMVQAQIRLGEFGIKRSDPDFLNLRVANTILGGAFSSRLVNRVRRDLGLTYSIYSAFDPQQDAGPFQIGTFSKNESVGQTVHETLSVLANFHDKGVTSEEVEQAKGYLSGIFPTSIETAEKLAFNLMVLRLYSIPDSYLANYLSELDKISVKEVNQAIQKHFDAKNIKILVYGSAPSISPQLKDLGTVEIKKASDFE